MKKILVNFHIGRGGRFYGQGYLSCAGVGEEIKDIIFQGDSVYPQEDGTYRDCSGNDLDVIDDESGYRVDFDGEYDTSYGVYISEFSDLSDTEQKAFLRDRNKFELELEGITLPVSEVEKEE